MVKHCNRLQGMRQVLRIVGGVVMMTMLMLGSVTIGNYKEAIDEAGKQRMRIVEIMKDRVMIETHNNYGNPEEDYKHLLSEFDETMSTLQGFVKSEESKKALKEAKKEWNTIRAKIQKPFDVKQAERFLSDADDFIAKENRLIQSLIKESKLKEGKSEINRAGLLRMLSQKIDLIYLVNSWKGEKDSSELKKQMQESLVLFRKTLDSLKSSKHNTSETNAILKKLDRIYFFFKMSSDSDGNYIPTLIDKKCKQMLAYAKKLVKLYKNAQ